MDEETMRRASVLIEFARRLQRDVGAARELVERNAPAAQILALLNGIEHRIGNDLSRVLADVYGIEDAS